MGCGEKNDRDPTLAFCTSETHNQNAGEWKTTSIFSTTKMAPKAATKKGESYSDPVAMNVFSFETNRLE